ncbi:MAG: MBL fold metallo-hydrolase [Ruminococcaceae bacterium]|nr:MBL fold metallo-hydrolase [Oscillospiraceae bacterium]
MKNVIHQLKTDGRPLDGMSYVIVCDDGSVIVVDGGMNNDIEYLYSYLKKLFKGEKPVVNDWILTHPHADHTFAFIGMAKNHGDDIEVRRVLYRVPEEEFFLKHQPEVIPEHKATLKAIETFGAEWYEPSAGDVIKYGTLSLEILYTCADLPKDEPIPQCTNDLSIVFRINANGQSIIFLGDVQAAGNRVMIDRYGKSLKSDVCQLAHHGELSSTAEFYTYIDPDIVLWPVTSAYVDYLWMFYEANRVLFMGLNVKDVIVSGDGTRALELPIKPSVAPNTYYIHPTGMLETVPEVEIVHAEKAPDLSDPDDPTWEKANSLPILGKVIGDEGAAKASVKLLWDEKAFWVRAEVEKREPLTFNKNGTLAERSDNVRIHLSEIVTGNLFEGWNDKENLRNVCLYSEKKAVEGGEYFNNVPSRCTSFGHVKENGFVVCAKIDFVNEHQKSDVIGFHAELNVCDENSVRTLRRTWRNGVAFQYFRFSPAGCVFAKLI